MFKDNLPKNQESRFGALDVRHMLTLYAGHLSWQSYERLCDAEDCQEDSLGPYDWPVTIYPTPFGWLMFVPDGWDAMPDTDRMSVPDDVCSILDLAARNGCHAVLLDWDGNECPSLPVHISMDGDGVVHGKKGD